MKTTKDKIWPFHKLRKIEVKTTVNREHLFSKSHLSREIDFSRKKK